MMPMTVIPVTVVPVTVMVVAVMPMAMFSFSARRREADDHQCRGACG
jgi:hypothetical protein